MVHHRCHVGLGSQHQPESATAPGRSGLRRQLPGQAVRLTGMEQDAALHGVPLLPAMSELSDPPALPARNLTTWQADPVSTGDLQDAQLFLLAKCPVWRQAGGVDPSRPLPTVAAGTAAPGECDQTDQGQQ